nr:HD domain-containing protein [uncultured Lacibacter sp.]
MIQPTDVHILADRILTELRTGLSSRLTYHSVKHTLDVMEQAAAIAEREGVDNPHDLLLLKVAALYHDTGFLQQYKGHEEVSCTKAMHDLPLIGCTDQELERICGMIRATKIPQQPANLLEQILADADLDYLGRDDFETIGQQLMNEFIFFGITKNEASFEELQLHFFESHHYCTASSQKLRAPVKQQHYEALRNKYLTERRS